MCNMKWNADYMVQMHTQKSHIMQMRLSLHRSNKTPNFLSSGTLEFLNFFSLSQLAPPFLSWECHVP